MINQQNATSLTQFYAPGDASLLKFDSPIIDNGETLTEQLTNDIQFHQTTDVHHQQTDHLQNGGTYVPTLDELLDRMFPPQRFTASEGHRCRHAISRLPGSRIDVVHLAENLNRLLVQQHARQAPLCPIRKELFSELFDELIRQVTIECPERGLLLLRIRDEIWMTLEVYRNIYENALKLSINSDRQLDHQTHSENRLEKLKEKKQKLKDDIINWERRVTVLSDVLESERQSAKKARKNEVDFWESKTQTLEFVLRTFKKAERDFNAMSVSPIT